VRAQANGHDKMDLGVTRYKSLYAPFYQWLSDFINIDADS
jgi:hypothetical protein